MRNFLYNLSYNELDINSCDYGFMDTGFYLQNYLDNDGINTGKYSETSEQCYHEKMNLIILTRMNSSCVYNMKNFMYILNYNELESLLL